MTSGRISDPAGDDGVPARDAQWQLAPGSDPRFKFWIDECIVYDAASGDTHILPASMARLLQLLQQGPTDVVSLAQLVAAEWQCEADAALQDDLRGALTDLRALALVDCIQP